MGDDSRPKPLSSPLLAPARIRSSSRGSSHSHASSCSGSERPWSSVSSDASTEADFMDTLRPGHPLHASPLKHVGCPSPPKSPRQGRRRPSVSGRTCVVKGPERFFYDKNSYTGVHKNG